jgi:asparagine synthase (glutamine-hydrolysing)
MCGICGFFETSGGRLAPPDLRRMTDAIAHRGPDADGAFLTEHGQAPIAGAASAPVGLGHRRLSILDLSTAANQPMLFENGRLAVVFNGEIFNYRELQAQHFAGRTPETTSDTEIIGWAYRRWGLDCFRHFNGFFALAIYDADRDLLVLARDRVGKKPLFYFHDGGHFAFGSELKALLPYPYFSKSLDQAALAEYFRLLYVPGEACILEKCRKLAAGGWLTVDGKGEIETGRYWDVLEAPARPTGPTRSEEEYAAQLDELLADATRLRLISDVPLGAFLSGGIDSSTIAAYLTQHLDRPLKTFTIAFEDPKFNEAPHAAAVARHLHTEHTEMLAQPSDALRLFPRLPYIYDEPFADPSALPTTMLSELTRRHVTVALSGDGGDELFFGYDRYTAALRFRRWGWIPHLLRAPLGHALMRLGDKPAKAGRGLDQRDVRDYILLKASIFGRYDLPPLLGRPYPAENEWTRALDRLADVPLHRRLRAVETRLYLADDILQKVDRASMSVALETRAPLLDYRIVEFALSLPQDMVRRGRVRKYLLKKLLFQRVPAALFDRPKAGFKIPLGPWFRRELKPMLDHYLEPDRLRRQGLLNPDYVGRLLADQAAGRINDAHKVFALLVFQLWWDAYFR